MYAPERQQAILGLARTDGRVDVNSLAEVFDVTPETIRRDLTGLERRGVLRRVHGGAIPVERLTLELAVEERYDTAGKYLGCRVYVGNSPDLLVLEDTDGDDKADKRYPQVDTS